MNLAHLRKGQTAVIDSIHDESRNHYLLDLGCFPGQKVKLNHKAIFGGPIAIDIAGYRLMLRKEEAANILIKPL